jgi:hypothetical protein
VTTQQHTLSFIYVCRPTSSVSSIKVTPQNVDRRYQCKLTEIRHSEKENNKSLYVTISAAGVVNTPMLRNGTVKNIPSTVSTFPVRPLLMENHIRS